MKQLESTLCATKLKLVCRFNGLFHPKPPYNELQYVGGETKVLTVERNVTFLRLATKICQLCPNMKSFCVKYKLVLCDNDSEWEHGLVSIACDDDVRCMVEEFEERVKLFGINYRIWLFVCCGEKKRCFCGSNSGIKRFDLPLIDFSRELSDEFCGSGKLRKDESFGECVKLPLNPRDENLISERNGVVHRMSRMSNVDCNGLSSSPCSVCGCVNGKHEWWNNGDIGKGLLSTCSCQRVWGGNQNRIPDCRFRFNEARSDQTYPYLVRSKKNVVHIGKENHRSLRNGGSNLYFGGSSSGDLLYNLSLSSSKEVKSPALTSFACSNASNTFLKSEIKPPTPIDEGKIVTIPEAEKPAAITCDYVSQGGPNIAKDWIHEEEIQQDPPSGLIVDEEAETKESIKGSNVIGGKSNDLAAFYTHLAAKQLQAIKYSELEFGKELGSGAFGTVYHGKWKGSDIAIKKLKPGCFTGGSVEEDRVVADFWKEAHILAQLHHPNIVALYGVVTDGPATNNLATVTEYMCNGSLRQVLRRNDRTIDRRKRLIIAMDAAFGMEYLHEKKIVHFDLKSHNLLVNVKDPRRPVCKIGDLGLSKIKRRTLVSGGVRGTIPWMAPELLNSKKMVTEKVDVYSFGVVMWELLTCEEPYANLRPEEIIGGIIKGTLRPEVPSWIDPTWRSLMERCWSSNPDERPAFSEISKELRAMAAAMNIK